MLLVLIMQCPQPDSFVFDHSRVVSTSFLHLLQNPLSTYWAFLYCFLKYLSRVVKLPGGGIPTLDFIVRTLMRINEATLATSFIISVVNGLELTIALTTTSRIFTHSSSYFHGSSVMNPGFITHFLFVAFKLLPCYFQVVDFFITPSNHHNFLLKSHQFCSD